jgi:hypothetical protein
LTVSVASGVAGVQAEGFPAASTDRNWTNVVPWPDTTADPPGIAEDQFVPSGDVRY